MAVDTCILIAVVGKIHWKMLSTLLNTAQNVLIYLLIYIYVIYSWYKHILCVCVCVYIYIYRLTRWRSSKESACQSKARDSGSIPEMQRSPGVGNGNLLQYSCQENSTDRGAWQAIVHGVTKLDVTEQIYTHMYIFSSVQLLSRVPLFATPWIAARHASLSITNSRSSPRLTSIKSSHLILCRPFLLAPNPSQHQSLFQWVNSSHELAKVLEFQL